MNLGDAKTVEFDGIPATNLNVVSATQITCKSPARRAGSVNVTVRTNADLVGTAPAAFTYASAFSLTRLNLAGYWRAADCTPVVTTSPVGLWWPGVPTLGPSIGRTTRILPPGGTGMVVGDLTASGKPSRRSTAAGFAQRTTSFASLFPTTSFTLFIVAKVRSAPNASATAANNACLLAGGGQYVFLRSNGQFGASLTGGQTAEATAAFSANTFAVYVVRFDGSRATAQLAVRVGNGAWSTANVTAPLVLSAPAAPPSPPVPVSLGYNPVANLYADADFAAVVVAGYAMSDADVTSSVNELVATYL